MTDAPYYRCKGDEETALPRFHFNSSNGAPHCDEIGTDLPNVAAARRQAAKYLGELLVETSFCSDCNDMQLDVTNHEGLILFSLFVSKRDAPALSH